MLFRWSTQGALTDMCRYKQLLGVSMLCIAGLSAFGQVSPIEVEVKVVQAAVKENETFSVSTAIYNTGSVGEVLKVWTCSYPMQWKSNSPIVNVNEVPCLQNVPFKIRLKPGEAYERAVTARVELSAGKSLTQSVTFRLGFQPATYGTEPEPRRIWSNAVTVSVTR